MNKKIGGLKEILDLYKNFFFDLDGVLWKGQQAVPGSFQVLRMLRQKNKNLFFITNSSIHTRQSLINKFKKFNFEAKLQECFPSAYFSTLYLKQRYPQIKRILVFGSQNMRTQFENSGFDVQHIKELPSFKSPIELLKDYLDLSIEAIVVGWDAEMTFMKQSLIGFYVQNGVKLFGTNPDKYTMIGSYKVPGAGSIIKAIQTGLNCKAEIIGKPNTFIIQHLINTKKLNKNECIMIGDNRQTDIKFGNDSGISTMCVLSGVTNQDDLTNEESLNKKAIPMYYSQSLYC